MWHYYLRLPLGSSNILPLLHASHLQAFSSWSLSSFVFTTVKLKTIITISMETDLAAPMETDMKEEPLQSCSFWNNSHPQCRQQLWMNWWTAVMPDTTNKQYKMTCLFKGITVDSSCAWISWMNILHGFIWKWPFHIIARNIGFVSLSKCASSLHYTSLYCILDFHFGGMLWAFCILSSLSSLSTPCLCLKRQRKQFRQTPACANLYSFSVYGYKWNGAFTGNQFWVVYSVN